MRRSAGLWLAPVAIFAAAPFAWAHFRLMEPQSWIVESNQGDPQKLGPCGGTSADPGKPSGMVNQAKGGQKLHLKLQETVYHPGHYRVALAVNSRSELPLDPETVSKDSLKGPQSVSAMIQNPPKMPVLADGLFVHTARQTDPFETDIQLPNISCPHCTLQIVEFMAEHGMNKDGGYFYHHCADLQITADSSKPMDTAWMQR